MDGANKCFQTLLGSNTRSAYFLSFDGMGGLRHSSKHFFFFLQVRERDRSFNCTGQTAELKGDVTSVTTSTLKPLMLALISTVTPVVQHCL